MPEPKAAELLGRAAAHMHDRSATYDEPEGERSMGKIVTAFNAITGRDLTESEGWMFMQQVKLVRQMIEAMGYEIATPADARQSLLRLTDAGHSHFAPLQQQSRDEAAALLAALAPAQRRRLIEAMATVQQLLDRLAKSAPKLVENLTPGALTLGVVVGAGPHREADQEHAAPPSVRAV